MDLISSNLDLFEGIGWLKDYEFMNVSQTWRDTINGSMSFNPDSAVKAQKNELDTMEKEEIICRVEEKTECSQELRVLIYSHM